MVSSPSARQLSGGPPGAVTSRSALARSRDVVQDATDVVLNRLHRIDGEPIHSQRGHLDADCPLDVIPADLVPARNITNAAFDPLAVDDLIGADALDHEQACREVSGGLEQQHDLALAHLRWRVCGLRSRERARGVPDRTVISVESRSLTGRPQLF